MSLDAVRILSVGSCDAQSRLGYYEASIVRKDKSIYYKADVSDTTANRCIIQGLIDCVKKLERPSSIVFSFGTKIGKSSRKKGPNTDLLLVLDDVVMKGNHMATYDIQEGQGSVLRATIREAEGFDHKLLPTAARVSYEDELSVSHRLDSHKNRQPFIYVIPPIDFGWEHLPTVEDTLKAIKRDEEIRSDGRELYDLAYRSEKFSKDWEQAVTIAKTMGMSSDFRQEPSVLWMPSELHMEYGFVFKEDNNGTTYVVSHIEMPWLESISMTRDILNNRPGGIQGTYKQVKWATDIVARAIDSYAEVNQEIPELANLCTRLADVLKLQREAGWIIANREEIRLRMKRKGTGLVGICARSWNENPLVSLLNDEEVQEMREFVF